MAMTPTVNSPSTTTPLKNGVDEQAASKPKRTIGRYIFDIFTYGGFTLVGNEWLSTVIMQQTKRDKAFPDDIGTAKLFTERFEASGRKISQWLKGIKSNYIHEGRLNYILWACIGGMLLVLPVKFLEDYRNKVVRFIDDVVHGKKTDDDPKFAASHKEMDAEAPQTWRSLGEGRIMVVICAQLVDFVIGWPKAISAQIVEKYVQGADKLSTTVRDLASYDRICLAFSRWVVGVFDPEAKSTVEQLLKTTHGDKRYQWHPQEGKKIEFTYIASTFLVLSSVLTGLFYVSSKMFARGQEAKRERKAERLQQNASPQGDARDEKVETTQTAPLAAEKTTAATPQPEDVPAKAEPKNPPVPRIGAVENQNRISASSALLQQPGG